MVAALGQVRERSQTALEGSGLQIGYTGDVALFADSEQSYAEPSGSSASPPSY